MQEVDLQSQSYEEFVKSGYPLEIFTNKKMMEQLSCAICLGVYRNPCTVIPCGHSFCKLCINSLQSKKDKTFACPRCRTQATGVVDNIDLNIIIKIQTVVCPVKALLKKPCDWTGTGESVDSHLTKDCKYRIRRCLCKKYLYSNDLIGVDVQCDCPEFKCKFCKKIYNLRNNHEVQCQEVIEKHKCGELIKRKDLAEHEKNCAEIEAVCKYCSFVGSKSRMAAHTSYECKEVMTFCKICASYVKKRDLLSHQQGGCAIPTLSGALLVKLSLENKEKVC